MSYIALTCLTMTYSFIVLFFFIFREAAQPLQGLDDVDLQEMLEILDLEAPLVFLDLMVFLDHLVVLDPRENEVSFFHIYIIFLVIYTIIVLPDIIFL